MTLIILLAISVFYAWRYSKAEIDPDFAAFNMQAFTGAKYGKDFADCKTPGIHWWFYAIAKIVGADAVRVRFTHHILISLPGLLISAYTGSIWGGLAFIVIVNSGWLYGFHGNIGQVPAGLLAISMLISNPILAPLFAWLATGFEPKLLLAFIFMAVVNGWWWALFWVGITGLAGIALRIINKQWFDWILESSVIVPARMQKHRTWDLYPYVPWFMAQWMGFLLPWIMAGMWYKPDILYWIPPIIFIVGQLSGKVIRPNHVIPVAPWIALAGIDWRIVLALCIIEAITSGLYFGDIWQRFYWGLMQANIVARQVGEWLRDKPGTIFVNHYHTAVYIYARKPPVHGLLVLMEVWTAAKERNEMAKKALVDNPPDWLVIGEDHRAILIKSPIYKMVHKIGNTTIWQKQPG